MERIAKMRKLPLFFIFLFVFSFVSMSFVSSLSLAVHIPEKYTEVSAGERFYFEIEVKYPENPERKDLRLNYEILTLDGEIIAQSKVLKAIETQASFMDFIVMPESAKKGMHTIRVAVSDYEDLSEEVEASFYITAGTDEQIKFYFFLLLGVVVLLAILVVIFLIRSSRKD